MQVRNLMEEVVLGRVRDAFEEIEQSEQDSYCTCYQCQLDVACYVLNRVSPEYVVSGRGIAHREADYLDSLQKRADLVTLISEGMRKIHGTKRPHFTHSNEKKKPAPEGAFYNFPSIVGRVFSSDTFEPLTDVEVSLKERGKMVEMIGPNWQNPCLTAEATPGTYTFWPKPIPAPYPESSSSFEFELTIEKKGYETLQHFFTVDLNAENAYIEYVRKQSSCKMEDLYLFPKS